jgi:plastocyanin
VSRRLAVLALCLGGAVGACATPLAAETGETRDVSMPAKVYVPRHLDVLVGDTVVWRNTDVTNHTVTARDDTFDSGFVAPGSTFAHTFGRVGATSYYCTIHKFMRGTIRVLPLVFSGPSEPIAFGGRVIFRGLAPSGSAKLTVERLGEDGWIGVDTPAVLADGSFSSVGRATAPARYRAVVGGKRSLTVLVRVVPRVKARRIGRILTATVRPSRAGARAVLQVYDRERFAWLTLVRGKASSASRVRLTIPRGLHGHLRVVIRGDSAWADAASAAVVVRATSR